MPVVLAQGTVTTGYFGDLAVTAYLRFTAEAGLIDSVLDVVGTEVAGRRPRREPVGRQLR